jgi:hypothetical protein
VIVSRSIVQTDNGDDLLAELRNDLWVSAELMEEPGKSAGSGVATSEKHRDQLVTENGAVTGVTCEGVEEGEALVGFCLLLQLVLG